MTRLQVERLFGVSRRQAVYLLHHFGAALLGNNLALDRVSFLEQLKELRGSKRVGDEFQRQSKFVAALERARTAGFKVKAPPKAQSLSGLPEGVSIEPGRIEVRFEAPRQAIEKLMALAQALVNDLAGFERLANSQQ